jgi:hypothetical protein
MCAFRIREKDPFNIRSTVVYTSALLSLGKSNELYRTAHKLIGGSLCAARVDVCVHISCLPAVEQGTSPVGHVARVVVRVVLIGLHWEESGR